MNAKAKNTSWLINYSSSRNIFQTKVITRWMCGGVITHQSCIKCGFSGRSKRVHVVECSGIGRVITDLYPGYNLASDDTSALDKLIQMFTWDPREPSAFKFELARMIMHIESVCLGKLYTQDDIDSAVRAPFEILNRQGRGHVNIIHRPNRMVA